MCLLGKEVMKLCVSDASFLELNIFKGYLKGLIDIVCDIWIHLYFMIYVKQIEFNVENDLKSIQV